MDCQAEPDNEMSGRFCAGDAVRFTYHILPELFHFEVNGGYLIQYLFNFPAFSTHPCVELNLIYFPEHFPESADDRVQFTSGQTHHYMP